MPINGKPTYYEFFGLNNFESDNLVIKKAYRAMALKWHPDRHPEDKKTDADRMMKQVNEVWRVLGTEKPRYDLYLRNKLERTREDPLRGAADAWSQASTTSWQFDWETLAKMHEAQMRDQVNSMRKQELMSRIVNRLDRMPYEKLKQVDDLIKMFAGGL